jgi:hypothetical protein
VTPAFFHAAKALTQEVSAKRRKNAVIDTGKQKRLGALPGRSKTPFSEPPSRVQPSLSANIKPNYEISGQNGGF